LIRTSLYAANVAALQEMQKNVPDANIMSLPGLRKIHIQVYRVFR